MSKNKNNIYDNKEVKKYFDELKKQNGGSLEMDWGKPVGKEFGSKDSDL